LLTCDPGCVIGVAYKELPPRVEYSLTEKGLAFLPILEQIKEWNLKFEIVSIPQEAGCI
jgi:DNA-binding HxlR family transcriptional regulator